MVEYNSKIVFLTGKTQLNVLKKDSHAFLINLFGSESFSQVTITLSIYCFPKKTASDGRGAPFD